MAHHYIYKITNLINNHYYIGMHSTNNLNDGYMGSGFRLKDEINEFGIDNFEKTIIEYYPDRETLKAAEIEIIDREIGNDLCINLAFGGCGGNTHPWTNESREKLRISMTGRLNDWGNKVSQALKGKPIDPITAAKAANSRRGERNGSWKNIDVNKIIELRNAGNSVNKISQIMEISMSTVKRKLKQYQQGVEHDRSKSKDNEDEWGTNSTS